MKYTKSMKKTLSEKLYIKLLLFQEKLNDISFSQFFKEDTFTEFFESCEKNNGVSIEFINEEYDAKLKITLDSKYPCKQLYNKNDYSFIIELFHASTNKRIQMFPLYYREEKIDIYLILSIFDYVSHSLIYLIGTYSMFVKILKDEKKEDKIFDFINKIESLSKEKDINVIFPDNNEGDLILQFPIEKIKNSSVLLIDSIVLTYAMFNEEYLELDDYTIKFYLEFSHITYYSKNYITHSQELGSSSELSQNSFIEIRKKTGDKISEDTTASFTRNFRLFTEEIDYNYLINLDKNTVNKQYVKYGKEFLELLANQFNYFISLVSND